MAEQTQQFRREIAYKTSIRSIQNGEPVQLEDGTTAAGIGSKKVKRVNIIATVIGKSEGAGYKEVLVDDGSGQLALRTFINSYENPTHILEKTGIGNLIMVIGRLRTYSQERYIAPEIVKPLKDAIWAEVRKNELADSAKDGHHAQPLDAENNKNDVLESESEDAETIKDRVRIYQLVKELDSGKGAELTEILAKLEDKKAPETIRTMVSNGDLFEVLPGRLKVLE